jgi:hypothetical protein
LNLISFHASCTVNAISRAAHASHFSSERFGNLHRKRTHTTRRTINQNLLPWLNLSFIAKTLRGKKEGSSVMGIELKVSEHSILSRRLGAGGPMKLYKIGQPWQNEPFYCQ